MGISKVFFLACLLALPFTAAIEAFFNITSNILRTGQMFNLTVSDSCKASYTVDFGDSTPIENLNRPQKTVSHSYTNAGNFDILVQSASAAPPECKSAKQSVGVRDPIQNMTFALSSTICRLGEYVNISVDVVPVSHVTAYWRFNKTANWTQAPIECTELGKNDVYVMAENGVSVSSSECFDHITVIDYNFTSTPEIGGINLTVTFTRTALKGVWNESNFTFLWAFGEGEVINCPNRTVQKSFSTSNPDPGHPVILSVYNEEGYSARLQKYIKIYDPVQAPILVSYPNITGSNSPTVFVVAPHIGHGVVYSWDFGDNSTMQNTTNRTITYSYPFNGDYCVVLIASNDFSEAILNFKITVAEEITGFGFVKNITPVETGFSTNIGIEVRNGSNFNVSVSFGDGSEPVWIINIDDVMDIFVISLWHNYSSAGDYNVTIKAWNILSTLTASSIAKVQDPLWNLTVQKMYATQCLEVNGTLTILLAVNGSDPQFYFDFGDGSTNVTSVGSMANHSYITNGDYILSLLALNDVSSVIKVTNVTVCKPVIPIVAMEVTASPTNITDPVEFSMTMAEGSDFECYFDYGDGSFEHFQRDCYNLTYFADGVTTDKTPFMNLQFKVAHNYSSAGRYEVRVNCSNRLSAVNLTLHSIVQKPIEDLYLTELSPKILGRDFPITWTMTNGTNVTFNLDIHWTAVSYSSFKTDVGDNPVLSINLTGVFLVMLQAKNLVSEANRSVILIVQDDVTQVSFNTWTTTSDWGSNIPGFGNGKNTFPCEYPVKFTATPDKGTNLTFWWKFDDGDERNTSESSITHTFAEGENEFWTNVTVFNLVSSVTKLFLVKTERSVQNLAITDNSPVKVNLTTRFQLSFFKYGTRTCVTMDMGDGHDGHSLFVYGGSHCHSTFPGYTLVLKNDDNILSIAQDYIYKTVTNFWVIVNASNTVSRQSLVFKSVTSKLSCFYPNATILGVGQNVSTATEVNRSESRLFETKNEVDCEASKTTAFRWEIFQISQDPVNYDHLRTPEPVQTGDMAYINVPATSLEFGFYKLCFTIKMEGVIGISGSAEGYIHVVATRNSLEPAVEGGLRKRYKFGGNIPLDTTLSVDRDYADVSQASPEYYWLCRNKSEPEFDTSGNLSAIPLVSMPELIRDYDNRNASENLGGCFGTGAGRLNFSGPLEQIDSRRGMTENSTYVITLVLVTHNPFFTKRAVFNHECVIVVGDPPEVEVSCFPFCPEKVNIDQKLSLKGTCKVCFGELTFQWNLYRHTALNMNPTDTDNMEEVPNLDDLSTTSSTSLNLALERDSLPPDTHFTATFRAYRPSGQYGEYFHPFITNAPPENGTCEVTPSKGSALNTSFTITCTGWEDPDGPLTYEFGYINYFQIYVFYVSSVSSAPSVKLPLGHEDNEFKLPLRIQIIDRLGAATIVLIDVKVYPPRLDSNMLNDIIKGEDGLLKEVLKTGNLQKAVETINSVCSYLNFLNRKGDLELQNENVTEDERASIQEQKDTREEYRLEILKDLAQFEVSNLGQIKLVASAMDMTTEVPRELNTQTQEMAFVSVSRLATVLKTQSDSNAGFFAIKEAAASILGAVGNVVISSTSMASVDADETNENITGYTGNSTDNGVVSSKERAKNRTLQLLAKIDDISHIVMENVVAGDVPERIKTRNFNLTLEKTLLESLGGNVVLNSETKFILPTLNEMGMSYDPNGTEKYSTVEIAMNSFPFNTFTWSNQSSHEVKSFLVGLTLKDEQRKPLNTSNFTEDVHIYIPRDAGKLEEPKEFYVIPMGNKQYIQYHSIEVDSTNFSFHIQVKPIDESTELTVLLLYNERPSPEKFDYNWTVPNFSNCSFRNVSRNVSLSSNISSSEVNSSANATNSTETEYHVVIDVVRDCKQDPYSYSISNSQVTKTGKYFLAVLYTEPEEPDGEEEGEVHPSTGPPTAARGRRGLPLECIGAHGRMKRSCVIIPPPPPKPTAPSKYQEGIKPPNEDFQGNTFNPNDTVHYLLRIYSSNCLFWDEENDNWINLGCKVGEETKPDLIHCKCNHLTSFASDFLVAPNPIDFDKVFSADLSKNFVVLLVVCLLFGLYIVLVVIARRFDKKDLEKLGATAVHNRGEASFPYLISIYTGVRQNAGTTSSVYIVLSGDEWESPPMPLVDHDRKVFQRGQENNFVVTFPRPLGNLTHIRIWHDNYGNNASWYLSRVSVDDLHTEERWYFICERWLAVEEDDGKVDRVLPVASDKELTHFQHLFVGKTVRELGDGHLWFSVVTRPANSPFTRVQRLSCCLSLLCLTMVTNCMFYNLGGEEKTMMIAIGSFEFDLRGLIIGLQASLIVFPVNFALVQIFRNVRPKKIKQQPDPDAPQKADNFSDISRCPSTEALPNASSQEYIIENEVKDNTSNKKDDKTKKKKKGLPHWFVYVAWVLCFLSSVTGAVITVFYSLSWGPEIANQWLIAFVTSFFQSILIIQPVKVVLAALFFAMIIRKPMDSNEDASEKKEVKESPDGKETGDDILLDYDDDAENYRPPDEDFLKSAREQRLKEVRMAEILKEIFTYFLFVLLLLMVAYGNRDTKAYLLRKNLHDIFVDVDQTGVDLADADDVDLFFHWARETLVPNLYPAELYNNKSDKYTGFIDDRYNYLVGISRFRQARVLEDSCDITDELKPYFNDCMAEYSVLYEEKGDYDIGWKYLNKTTTTSFRRKRSVEEQFAFLKGEENKTLRAFGDQSRVRFRRAIEPIYTSTSGRQQRKRKRPTDTAKNYYVLDSALLPDGSIISCPTRWLYHDMLELRGYPFWGRMTLYSGGGYPADLGYDYSTALTVIADLHSHNWVDPQTRAVFIEFTVYNANVNLFGIAFLFVEFLPTGGAFPYSHFVVSRLYNYVGPFSSFVLACQIIMVLFMFYFMYREGKKIYKQRKAYFHGFFNWMEVVLIICEFAMGILYITRWWQVDKNFLKLRYNPKDFVSFQYAGAADESLSLIMGLLVFLVTIRFLKLFRFNKRMSLVGSTIAACAKPLAAFLVNFMLVFLAYAILAFLAFSGDNENFKNFLTTFETQTSIILGDFDYRDIEATNRLLGPAYFFTFMYFSVFYLLNMFMAILNDSFAEVKSSNDKQQNEYEMVEFILSKFRESLGLNRNRVGTGMGPFGDKSSGFPSSPPFRPSDYKHRDDSLSECSRMELDDVMLAGKSVLRALAALNKNMDRLTAFVEKNGKLEAKDDQTLIDMLNDIKGQEFKQRRISILSERASLYSAQTTRL